MITQTSRKTGLKMANVAFIGTGLMGSGMAERLLKNGHNVTVYNRTQSKTLGLVEMGARLAKSPSEAVGDVDVIYSMVGNDEASQAIWFGVNGVFSTKRKRQLICIECSTLSHNWVSDLSSAISKAGHIYIDSPVTGLPEAAQKGELTLFVGASEINLQLAKPFLAPLCREFIHFGEVGAGTAYKLIVNLMGSVQIAAVAEGMLIAEKAGLNLNLVVDALSKGAAGSPQVVRNSRLMADNCHDENVVFPAEWRLKDTLYGLALAEKFGQDVPVAKAAKTGFQKLVDDGFGDLAESKLIDVLRS